MKPLIKAAGSYITVLSSDWIFPPGSRMPDANVSGAGSPVNGRYSYDGTKWANGSVTIEAAPHWSIRSGATIYYTATATEFPWEAPVWIVGAGGTGPVPTVTEAT
jgi:hypothetical protein